MILDPVACIPDAGFFPDGRTNQPTDGQADSRSWKRVSMIIDPHACVFDACMMRLKFCDERTDGRTRRF